MPGASVFFFCGSNLVLCGGVVDFNENEHAGACLVCLLSAIPWCSRCRVHLSAIRTDRFVFRLSSNRLSFFLYYRENTLPRRRLFRPRQ